MFWQRPLSAGFFLPMNSVGWAGLLLKTLPTAKFQRFWIGTSVQWDRASFVEGFEDKAFQGCVCMTIWLCFGFRVAAILPLKNGWRVLFFPWFRRKQNSTFPSLHDCVWRKACRTEQQTCSRPHQWNHTDFRNL